MYKKVFDWTTGFDLRPDAYHSDVQEDKIALTIPVFGAEKKDIVIKPNRRAGKCLLQVDIPDTILSKSRELMFDVHQEYDLSKVKANVRDGMLFIHIPLKEMSKPQRIEIS